MCRVYPREGRPAIKIVLDITRLVKEGKLTAQEAERLQALAARDTGSLAINVLMSFGAVAVAAGIIALQPAFTTGAALGVARGLVDTAAQLPGRVDGGRADPVAPGVARAS